MKVKELIEKLQKYDQEMLALVEGYEGGYDPAWCIKQISVIGPLKRQWYYGEYENSTEDDLLKFEAIVITK